MTDEPFGRIVCVAFATVFGEFDAIGGFEEKILIAVRGKCASTGVDLMGCDGYEVDQCGWHVPL